MNRRVCQHLRGLARARTVGLPERKYEFKVYTRKHRYLAADGLMKVREYEVYTARLSLQSTRGLYRAFKKAYRRTAA